MAEAEVSEADFVEDGELVDDFGMAGEEAQGFLHGEAEDIVDVFAFVLDFEDAGFVAGAVALFAGEFDVSEKLHFDGDGAVSVADVAAAAGDVEGEIAGRVTAPAGFGLGGEELADGVEGLDVGDGIGARRATDGGLVDEDDVIEAVGTVNGAVEVGWVAALDTAELVGDDLVEDLVYEGGLSAAGDAGDTDEDVEGDLNVEAQDVVGAGAFEANVHAAVVEVDFAAEFGDGDGEASAEVFAGDRGGVLFDFLDGS